MRNFSISLVLMTLTAFILINHIGSVPKLYDDHKPDQRVPAILVNQTDSHHRSVILQGSDYNRGYSFGEIMKENLVTIEATMVSKLDGFIGNRFIQSVFFSAAMIWFHDADKFIDSSSLAEMQGVSAFAPEKYDYLADGFTRQIAYHGLHEVGQMFVDEDQVDMGCFATLLPTKDNNWVIGRNFDFDVDGMFDREKILKWSFPNNGIPYLSVIWAGMVGGVTGVNREGIYVSINAAGSDDFARVGMPTTIMVKNILTEATSIAEAVKILEMSPAFITDIFLIGDRKTGKTAIVEKSPKRMDIRYPENAQVIANHLMGSIWKGDENNYNRTVNLTSESRYNRGLELLKEVEGQDPLVSTVKMLRDKNLPNNSQTHIGNRGAIDSLIASQSVIYDMAADLFYVNLGPGAQGKYIGYDLKASFAQKMPVAAKEIAALPMTQQEYDHWQGLMVILKEAGNFLKDKKCVESAAKIKLISDPSFVHYDKERLLGDYAELCDKNLEVAKNHWRSALALHPAYAKQRTYLEEKLK